ncbi:hypothetical protein GH714_029410 [Hevea brasiliensis]|uniref:AT-hook motif nuclear-localized protein n=1 Tax=Hevea brasiliensis TaxID=3981 RepID=A0A6A6LG03_HEVBR|nr:hypothetical protein GH714_029410 [Hevea brasiliensis]
MEARETVSSSSVGGVTVVGSDVPSDYQIAPRSADNPSSAPGSAPPPPPAVVHPPSTAASMPLKKKRGRPRKYGPDGSVTMALSPKPISSAAPALPPSDSFFCQVGLDVCISGIMVLTCHIFHLFLCWVLGRLSEFTLFYHFSRVTYRMYRQMKVDSSIYGEWVACSVGANFTPHIITVNAGEGRFEILSLSGSFMPTESGGTRSRSGGMSVSLASPDGRVVGGGVAGLLVAASPVQGTSMSRNQRSRNLTQYQLSSHSTVAVPISTADPKPNLSSPTFRGDNWSPLPSDSKNKPTDINVSLPAG